MVTVCDRRIGGRTGGEVEAIVNQPIAHLTGNIEELGDQMAVDAPMILAHPILEGRASIKLNTCIELNLGAKGHGFRGQGTRATQARGFLDQDHFRALLCRAGSSCRSRRTAADNHHIRII